MNAKTTCQMNEFELFVFEKQDVKCQDVQQLVHDYIDGDLSQSLAERIKEHTKTCRFCRREIGEYRLVLDLAKSLPTPVMPQAAKDRLRAALNQKLGLKI